MDKKEFRPLPEEFNLGYKPPVKEEEEEKKKKRKRRLRKILALAATVLIILPLALRTGLFSDPSSRGDASSNAAVVPASNIQPDEKDPETDTVLLKEGTYYSGETYAHFENARGWFSNGEYFIPLQYDPETLRYTASGAYPETIGMALDSTAYYVSAEGEIGIKEEDLILYNPFTQKTDRFAPSSRIFDTTYINKAHALSFEVGSLLGNWTGVLSPASDHPMAYLKSLELLPDGRLVIVAGDTETTETKTFTGGWEFANGVLHTSFELPLEYEIKNGDSVIRYTFDQMPEGILFYDEQGCYIYLNIFASQLFAH